MRRAIEIDMTTAIVALRPFAPNPESRQVAANDPASGALVAARTDAGVVSPDVVAAISFILRDRRLQVSWTRSKADARASRR